ncbi:hypothetical protein [Pontibacter vulgaris]|uniref:hypothetical protein n=1 Tax=Pontibacter vulgaris TaxID=2905679 RepID=UPI001FA80E62|nr:hypothetical protein [Pontibacter vulgaris]
MYKLLKVTAIIGLATFFSCQKATTESEATLTQEQTTASADTAQAQRRPAPTFHKIPTDMAKNRVYICDDDVSDTFHQKNDCQLLLQCKASFRNLTLLRAVENYGRYNCETCSKELAFVFIEGNVN